MSKPVRVIPILIGYPGSGSNNKCEDSPIAIHLPFGARMSLLQFFRLFRGTRAELENIPPNALRMALEYVNQDGNVEKYVPLVCAAEDMGCSHCDPGDFLFCLTATEHQELEAMFKEWNTGGRLDVRLWEPVERVTYKVELFKPRWEKRRSAQKGVWARMCYRLKIIAARKIVVLGERSVEGSGARLLQDGNTLYPSASYSDVPLL